MHPWAARLRAKVAGAASSSAAGPGPSGLRDGGLTGMAIRSGHGGGRGATEATTVTTARRSVRTEGAGATTAAVGITLTAPAAWTRGGRWRVAGEKKRRRFRGAVVRGMQERGGGVTVTHDSTRGRARGGVAAAAAAVVALLARASCASRGASPLNDGAEWHASHGVHIGSCRPEIEHGDFMGRPGAVG